jgi:cell division protein FtsB
MTRRPTLNLLRAALWPAVALFVVVYFAGSAFVGPNGLTSLAGYKKERADKQAALLALQAERDRLAHRAALLDPRHVDPDLADELVRRKTGQIRPDEVILPAH